MEGQNEVAMETSTQSGAIQEEAGPHVTSTELAPEEHQEVQVQQEDKEQQCFKEAHPEVPQKTSPQRKSSEMETEPLNNQGPEKVHHDSEPIHGSEEVQGPEEVHGSKEVQTTKEVQGSEEIHEGRKGSEAEYSKTCPPKISAEEREHLSLQALQEPDELSRKSLKERISPSKKQEELEEAAGLTEDKLEPQPDSKDLKKVKENTPSPREITN